MTGGEVREHVVGYTTGTYRFPICALSWVDPGDGTTYVAPLGTAPPGPDGPSVGWVPAEHAARRGMWPPVDGTAP